MQFLHHSLYSYLRRCRQHHHRHHVRTLYEAVTSLKCPRDRGFDHAVERERHLKPLLKLKNLIISEPSKSMPLSLITQSKETLEIPFRPIEFTRKYPSIFQEFQPGSLNIQPHIKLTPEVVTLSSEENLLYQSVNYKQEIAGRLLKLLMISRINKIPIILLERLKWELGLPQDYEKVIIPEFPDYFRVITGKNWGENGKVLELVCWADEFAVSEMEKKGAKDGNIQFCLQYSKGFEMDKKYKKWVDEWQKLPYVSPYENAVHLAAKTDESDKWAVAVLHEVLSLFVGKKAERESLLYLGECLGLRSRFKLAFLQHPGIFYVSSKIGTHTVVLREAYKRGMLIERHPLMDMRFKYVQLMNVVKDEERPKKTQQKTSIHVKNGEGEELEDGEEDNTEIYDSSDEDEKDDYEDAAEGEIVTKRGRFKRKATEFEEKNPRRGLARRNDDEKHDYTEAVEGENVTKRGRFERKAAKFEEKNPKRVVARRNDDEKDDYKEAVEGENATRRGIFKRRATKFEEKNPRRSVARRSYDEKGDYKEAVEGENVANRGRFERKAAKFEGKNPTRSVARRSYDGKGDYKEIVEGENVPKRGRFERKGAKFEENNPRRSVARRKNGRSSEETVFKSSTRFSRRTNMRGGDLNAPRRPPQKLDVSGNRARLRTEKTSA